MRVFTTKVSKTSKLGLIPALFLLLLLSCREEPGTKPGEQSQLEDLYGRVPNPAAVYCEELGYQHEIRTSPSGGQYGACVFPDGSECRAWDFLRGKCGQQFTYCEKQGYRIENRVKDMGSWTMEYAVCVFPNGSERPEWTFFQERVKKTKEQ